VPDQDLPATATRVGLDLRESNPPIGDRPGVVPDTVTGRRVGERDLGAADRDSPADGLRATLHRVAGRTERQDHLVACHAADPIALELGRRCVGGRRRRARSQAGGPAGASGRRGGRARRGWTCHRGRTAGARQHEHDGAAADCPPAVALMLQCGRDHPSTLFGAVNQTGRRP